MATQSRRNWKECHKWWVWQDLNLWPRAYQARALTNWATDPTMQFQCREWLLRSLPHLTATPQGPKNVEARRFELLTSSLQSWRSTNWAMPPEKIQGCSLRFFFRFDSFQNQERQRLNCALRNQSNWRADIKFWCNSFRPAFLRKHLTYLNTS